MPSTDDSVDPPEKSKPGKLKLTDGQLAALEHLLQGISSGDHAALHGPAGTGKTTLTRHLWDELRDRGLRVVALSPTHKAAAVLRSVLPRGAEVLTVASALQLRPQIRGRHLVFVPDRYGKTGIRGEPDVLLVDESSMVSAQLGTLLEALADRLGATLICIGDAAQLPPVDAGRPAEEDAEEGDPDHLDAVRHAPQFLAPAGGVAQLTQVVRHQGPVLQLATAIREHGPDAAWPTRSSRDNDSSITVYDLPSEWLNAAAERICTEDWDDDPDRCRVVAWANRTVHGLGAALRNRRYGKAAAGLWLPGEVLNNGDAISPPGESLAPPMAPASCEWRVIEAEAIELAKLTGRFAWQTPERKLDRELVIEARAQVARLVLEPVTTGLPLGRIEVFTELPGRKDWGEQITAARQAIVKANLSAFDRKRAWRAWHGLRSWTADLRPAAVLTVHRSQGSTFQEVFVAGDLAHCQGRESRALHYVAVSRASKALHLLRRQGVA